MPLSDAIIGKAYRKFRTGEHKANPAALTAMDEFLIRVDRGDLSEEKASRILDSREKVSNFIGKIQTKASEEKAAAEKKREAAREAQLANIERAANGAHDSSRRMEAELSKLHSITTELQGASKNLIKHAGESADKLQSVVRSTSTKTAFAVGLSVGLLSGIPGGIVANYLYERHFSVDALKGKNVASSASSSPPTGSTAETPLAFGHFGSLNDGPIILSLLNEGESVTLPMQNGVSVCLRMPKPIPCVGAEVPKLQHRVETAPVRYIHRPAIRDHRHNRS